MGMWQGTDTQTAVTTIHFALAVSYAKCNDNNELNTFLYNDVMPWFHVQLLHAILLQFLQGLVK